MDFGGVWGAKMAPKSMKNRSKNDTNKMIEKWVQKSHAGSRKVAQGCAGRRGGAPYNQSIHPSKTAAVDPLSLHFVPQGHGGGYIYIYIYVCV